MPFSRRMLLVEDDFNLRSTMVDQILSTGQFDIDEAGSAAEAEALLANDTQYDAVLECVRE